VTYRAVFQRTSATSRIFIPAKIPPEDALTSHATRARLGLARVAICAFAVLRAASRASGPNPIPRPTMTEAPAPSHAEQAFDP